MAQKEALSCTKCEAPTHQGIQTTFLGLRKFTCPWCQHWNTFPATKGMVTFCWVVTAFMGFVSVQTLAQGGIPLPGGLGIAAVWVLAVSGKAGRRAEQERLDFAHERYLNQRKVTPPPLPPQW